MRMRKKKHSAERIAACSRFLIENPLELRNGAGAFFDADRPLAIEIGCGKGDFATSLCAAERDVNLIALERVPDVAMFALEKAAATAESRPDNLRFIIGNASYLSDWFAPHSVSVIYINFCDPWPKTGYHKRRLTAPSYLRVYSRLLVPGGEVRFKTDNEDLFEWSVQQAGALGIEMPFITRDLHSSPVAGENIMTEYEKRFTALGVPIRSFRLVFREELPEPGDENGN